LNNIEMIGMAIVIAPLVFAVAFGMAEVGSRRRGSGRTPITLVVRLIDVTSHAMLQAAALVPGRRREPSLDFPNVESSRESRLFLEVLKRRQEREQQKKLVIDLVRRGV
jgi:hypothetical protein